MLPKLLLTPPRPIIICSDGVSAADSILIADDGSLTRMRAVQMIAPLQIGLGQLISRHFGRYKREAGSAKNYQCRGLPSNSWPRGRLKPYRISSTSGKGAMRRSRKPENRDDGHGRVRSSWDSKPFVWFDDAHSGGKPTLHALPVSLIDALLTRRPREYARISITHSARDIDADRSTSLSGSRRKETM